MASSRGAGGSIGDAATPMRMLRIKLEFMSSCVACVCLHIVSHLGVCVCARARACARH
jgi:hypothetical protein